MISVEKAYKFELRPTGEQLRMFAKFAGSRRFIYNLGLELHNQRHKDGEKFLSYSKISTEPLNNWKAQYPWLFDTQSQALQQGLKDLDNAFQKFFRKEADYPQFKRKGVRDSFRYPQIQPHHVDQANCRVHLSKIGWVRMRQSRPIEGKVNSITVSKRGDRWYASFQVTIKVQKPVPKASSAIGVDVGIKRFCAYSDGSFVEPMNAYRDLQAKLARLQKGLSRKVKFSKNWIKQKKKIANLHIRIANVRTNHLHKVSNTLSKNHAMIAIEDLKVKQMSKSAKGTLAAPGVNVRAKNGLNKSILDQGWGEFRRQLEYKAVWSGSIVVAVPPHYTSQMCPCCGHTHKDNRKTQANFECVECGFKENADVVGAKNILARAHQQLAVGRTATACGEAPLGASVKQEPTEVTPALSS